jgi:signal transduction histidine kinase
VFQRIRYRLLLSYLAVLTLILTVFAITVHLMFARSLSAELRERLTVLAKAASSEVDVEGETLVVDASGLLIAPHQTVQWFDTQGRLIDQRGDISVKPPNSQQLSQAQTSPYLGQSITLPTREEEKNNMLIGYVRVSESSAETDETLRQLDWGLGGGIVLALVLSGLGGVWLTRQAMQPIERSFQKLQQFTADASHELRNPLMAIKSNAAVALKYPEGMRSSDAQKFQVIAHATTQMTALTEDLLMLARADQSPGFRQEIVDLKLTLEQLAQVYQSQADLKQVALDVQILSPLLIGGDPVQMTRLFTNLMDNALRYTPAQGTIQVQGTWEGHMAVISVRDTGIGIAPEQLDHIFDRFWRADPSRSHHSGGFGLGLAIAQSIVQSHGGRIAVTSQLGVGSCFTVQLPSVQPIAQVQ